MMVASWAMSPSLVPATLQFPRVRFPCTCLVCACTAPRVSSACSLALVLWRAHRASSTQASSQMTLASDGSFPDRGGAAREARGMHGGRFPSDGAFDLSYLGAAGSSDGGLSRHLTSMSGSTHVSADSLDDAQVAAQADFVQYDRRVFNPVRTAPTAPLSTIAVRRAQWRAQSERALLVSMWSRRSHACVGVASSRRTAQLLRSCLAAWRRSHDRSLGADCSGRYGACSGCQVGGSSLWHPYHNAAIRGCDRTLRHPRLPTRRAVQWWAVACATLRRRRPWRHSACLCTQRHGDRHWHNLRHRACQCQTCGA